MNSPKFFLFVAAVCISFSLAPAQTVVLPGFVSGDWNADGSPYLITGMIIVHPDSTLNIGPGVEVNFQDHYKFIVNGLLNAEGTEQDSILFTTEYTLMGWNGIRFLGAVDSSHLSYCIFEYGRALGVEMNTDSWGGAIFCEYSNPVIRHCTFRDNYAEWYGGAMEVDYSSPVIDHCVFTDNTAASSAGALSYYGGCGGSLYNCDFFDNTAGYGGAINLYDNCIVSISYCNFVGNSSSLVESGAIGFVEGSDCTLEYCFFENNSSITGGALNVGASDPLIINNTFTGNSAEIAGGAILAKGGSNPILINNICWGNSPNEIEFGATSASNTITIAYCDIEGGEAGIDLNGNGTVNWEAGNRDEEPCFTDPTNGDYTLLEDSPCIDAGTAFFEWGGSAVLDLDPSQYEGNAPDIGAYESSFTSIGNTPVNTPNQFTLLPPYPNPFNNSTIITYELASASEINFTIYDITGREVASLVNGQMSSGLHEVTWNAEGMGSGVYFVRLEAGELTQTRKLLLVK